MRDAFPIVRADLLSRPLSAMVLVWMLCAGCYSATNPSGPPTYNNPGTLTLEPNQLNQSNGTSTPPQKLTLVYGVASQTCLTVVENNVQFDSCAGTAEQTWTYQHGQLQASDGQCLSVSQANPVAGTTAALVPCDATYTVVNQQWTYQAGELVLNNSSLCLLPVQANPSPAVWKCGAQAVNNDSMWVLGYSASNGVYGTLWTPAGVNAPCMTAVTSTSAVALSACTQSPTQAWAAAGTTIISLGAGLCVSLDPTSGAQGAGAILAACDGSAPQQFAFEGGQIRLQGTTTCLVVDSRNPGSVLHGTPCANADTTAQWAFGL